MPKILFTGDLMCQMQQLNACTTKDGYDFFALFEYEKNVLSDCDILVGNLETPIAGKELGFTDERYRFNTPVEYAHALKQAGFHLLSTANNHCMDRGYQGISATLDALDIAGIEYVGTHRSEEERGRSKMIQTEGIAVGFVAYTYGTNAFHHHRFLEKGQEFAVNLFQPEETLDGAVDLLNDDAIPKQVYDLYDVPNDIFTEKILPHLQQMRRDIQRVRADGAEYVVMLLHSGGQYNPWPDALTLRIAEWCRMSGADAVIGNHPHVIHPLEVRSGCPIAFSLGNFLYTPQEEHAEHALLPEYSIVFGIDIARRGHKVERVGMTFSVHKSIISENGKSVVMPVYKLYEQTAESAARKRLLSDNQCCVNKFLGNPLTAPVQMCVSYNCC